VPRSRALARGLDWVATAVRSVAFWRRKKLAGRPKETSERKGRERERLAIGFAQGLLAEGDVVSKPVLLG
jgi:hypothetical protein